MPKPEEVFRFVNVRPVQAAPAARVQRGFATYDEAGLPPLHRQIQRLGEPGIREKAATLARERLAQKEPIGDQIEQIVELVRRAAGAATVAEAKRIVTEGLGDAVEDVLGSEDLRTLKVILWDWMYAHTLAPDERPEERESVYLAIRALHFLRVLAEQNDDEPPLAWTDVARITPTLPKA